jgi:hypothetical protein
MILTEPHTTELPHPVIFHEMHPGIHVTHIVELPPDVENQDGWSWYCIAQDDVKKFFDQNLGELVELHDNNECSESVLDDWADYNPEATYAFS